MENRYRQMLVDEKAHSELREAKRMLSSCIGTRMSYRDVSRIVFNKRNLGF